MNSVGAYSAAVRTAQAVSSGKNSPQNQTAAAQILQETVETMKQFQPPPGANGHILNRFA